MAYDRVLEGDKARVILANDGHAIGKYIIDDRARNQWPPKNEHPGRYIATVCDMDGQELATIDVTRQNTFIALSGLQISGYEDRHPEGQPQMTYSATPIKMNTAEDPRHNEELYVFAKIVAENRGESMRELREHIQNTVSHYAGAVMA